jgi:hypothetical protein
LKPNSPRTWSIALVAAFVGTATQAQLPEPKVTVVNNEFVCARNPKLTLKVQPCFKYLGHIQDFEEASSYSNPKKGSHKQQDSYLFADTTNPKSPIIFSISIHQLAGRRWYFFNDLHERLPENRYFEKNWLKIGDTNYRTATLIGNMFTQKEISFMVDHDIKVPRMFMTRLVEGTVTFSGNMKVSMSYAQDIIGLSDNALTPASLTEAQKNLSNSFIQAANVFFDVH